MVLKSHERIKATVSDARDDVHHRAHVHDDILRDLYIHHNDLRRNLRVLGQPQPQAQPQPRKIEPQGAREISASKNSLSVNNCKI